MNTTFGSCACKNIEYCFTGAPINSAYCYCTQCQLYTNSDKWYGLWVPQENFSFTKGQTKTFIRKGDSGMDMCHHFCDNCGVNLAVKVEIGGFFSVAANTVTKGEVPAPNMLIYTKNAARWAHFPSGVPKFDILPAEMMGE
ncbi:GFA family protein [Agaribacterium haliotis]|uniref:GFA family protein n=1 Tax=Agaribacterium haliotis TaxID=2013869 RepID=UPI000BB53E55|nr:GFA family protein [Agaribacterium haliotis]